MNYIFAVIGRKVICWKFRSFSSAEDLGTNLATNVNSNKAIVVLIQTGVNVRAQISNFLFYHLICYYRSTRFQAVKFISEKLVSSGANVNLLKWEFIWCPDRTKKVMCQKDNLWFDVGMILLLLQFLSESLCSALLTFKRKSTY